MAGESKIIAVDFDGTIVRHAYPHIGEELYLASTVLLALQAEGHRLILWTIRSGVELEAAVKFCEAKGITFWGVNSNNEQTAWSDSRKVYAHLYIDDAALGCPGTRPAKDARLEVDWSKVLYFLRRDGFLP